MPPPSAHASVRLPRTEVFHCSLARRARRTSSPAVVVRVFWFLLEKHFIFRLPHTRSTTRHRRHRINGRQQSPPVCGGVARGCVLRVRRPPTTTMSPDHRRRSPAVVTRFAVWVRFAHRFALPPPAADSGIVFAPPPEKRRQNRKWSTDARTWKWSTCLRTG